MLRSSEDYDYDLPEEYGPDTQIVEIDPGEDLPSLPPEVEQTIIKDILEIPDNEDIMRLPEIKKPEHNRSPN